MTEQTNSVDIKTNVPHSSIVKKLSFFTAIGLSFFLPIFFIPSATVSFLAGKHIILILAVTILFLLWAFERIKNKDFSVSRNLFFLFATLVPFAYLLSALFSGFVKDSIIGKSFETGSFGIISVLFLLMFFTASSYQSKKKVLHFYVGLLLAFAVMVLFHATRLIFGPEFLSLGMFNSATANFIGSWNELGVFFGLIALLSLSSLEFMGQNKIMRVLNYIVLAISLFFVALVNFTTVWILLGILSLILIAYTVWLKKVSERTLTSKNTPVFATIVLLLSLIFIFAKGPVGGFLPSFFNISNLEVRPTISATIDIAQATLSQDPIFGAGPNRFASQWVAQKPAEINNTQFWNVDFNSGSSFILTSLITIGLFGFLAWILFLGAILYFGFKLLKMSRQNKFFHYLALSSFSAVVYLWIFSIVYVPGIVILGLSFLFTGVLLSLLYQDKIIKTKTISFSRNKGKSISLITAIIVISLVFLYGSFLCIQKTTASVQAQKSLLALNVEGDLGKAVELMTKASQTFKTDLYYRLLTEMNLSQLQFVLNQQDVPEETLQQQFQTVFGNAVANAENAVGLDEKNYQNWANLGRTYKSVVPLKLEGAYDNAMNFYVNAINLNPRNPALILSLARLEIANEDIEKAREYIVASVQTKNDYADAYYLLSQIELNEGNNEEAIKIIEALANVSPDNPQVFAQLGALEYNLKNYEKAVLVLERAVSLNPYFVDAKYLLGLSYNGAGEKDKAIGQFEDLNILSPNNADIMTVLDNLKNDRDLFYGLEQEATTSQLQSGVDEMDEAEDDSDEEDDDEEIEE